MLCRGPSPTRHLNPLKTNHTKLALLPHSPPSFPHPTVPRPLPVRLLTFRKISSRPSSKKRKTCIGASAAPSAAAAAAAGLLPPTPSPSPAPCPPTCFAWLGQQPPSALAPPPCCCCRPCRTLARQRTHRSQPHVGSGQWKWRLGMAVAQPSHRTRCESMLVDGTASRLSNPEARAWAEERNGKCQWHRRGGGSSQVEGPSKRHPGGL